MAPKKWPDRLRDEIHPEHISVLKLAGPSWLIARSQPEQLRTKPMSWTILGVWIAVEFTWIETTWSANWQCDRRRAWRWKREGIAEPIAIIEPTSEPPKRGIKRQVA